MPDDKKAKAKQRRKETTKAMKQEINNMKTRWITLTLSLALALLSGMGANAQTQETELAIVGQAFAPHQSDRWRNAGGVEVKLLMWVNERTGVALAGGVQNWKAFDEYAESRGPHSTLTMSLDGSNTLAPLGLSLLHRSRFGDSISLILEAGLRYAFVESDIHVRTSYHDAAGSDWAIDRVEADDTTLAVLGLLLDARIGDGISLAFGVGRQFDLQKSHEYVDGLPLGRSRYDAGTLSLGLVFSF